MHQVTSLGKGWIISGNEPGHRLAHIKNYNRKQILITKESRENFNPAIAYNLAKKVYYKNFRFKFKIAEEIKSDLIQEAAVRLFELSGKKSTTEKYDDNYCRFWIAHNAMLALSKPGKSR